MISSHLPTLTGQRSLAMISLAVCSPKWGHRREEMARGQGGFSTSSLAVEYLNALYQAPVCGWLWVVWAQKLGILNVAKSKTFPDYQPSPKRRGRLTTSLGFWLEVTLVSLC